MKNKIRAWFTTTRLIVYGVLSGIVLIGTGTFTISTGIHAVGAQITQADSCLFERWHAPKDNVRAIRENEIYFALLRTQYLLQEIATEGMKINATNRFKQDSTRWSQR